VTEDELSLMEKEWKQEEQEIFSFWARADKSKKDG
jgi:hypothetical protein